jgi:hypothetical protein
MAAEVGAILADDANPTAFVNRLATANDQFVRWS